MFKLVREKRGSAYLIALGVLSVLIISAGLVSRLTVSGRWNTIFTSNEKKAEECAESAANLTFKIIKEKMNDPSVFYDSFPFTTDSNKLLDIMTSEYMFFRLPAFITEANLNSLDTYKKEGVDVQLDMLKNASLAPYYKKGIVYYYDTETTNPNTPLAPLQQMFKSLGGKVSVQCTGRIKQAFGILPDSPDYKVAAMETPVRKVTGFLSSLFDKAISGDSSGSTGFEPTTDTESVPDLNLSILTPDNPEFLKAPSLTEGPFWWLPNDGLGLLKPLIQFIVDLIMDSMRNKIMKKLNISNLTPKEFSKAIFGRELNIRIPFGTIINQIKSIITKCLPNTFTALAGTAINSVTVEKKGFFEVETIVTYEPKYPDPKGEKIVKKLKIQREFIVADIQPVAPDYSFFVGNSKLLYENNEVENPDHWEGDDHIDWNAGNGELVVHNLPDYDKSSDRINFNEFEKSINSLSNSSSGEELKKLIKSIKLPGLVRVNGTKEMQIKIGMLPSKSDYNLRNIKKLELAALMLPHKNGGPTCGHSDGGRHNMEPRVHTTWFPFCFFDDGKPFDWGYYGGGNPGGRGSYWLATSFPKFGRTLFFGDMHLEAPFSLRAEGYLKKVYTHINILIVCIGIPPIWIIGFPGIAIPIPWFWAKAKAEPYGFCQYPAFDTEEAGKNAWNPNQYYNLPSNLYSNAQYLKKCSFYYNSQEDFKKDIKNRSVKVGKENIFICDGVTFINDNLSLGPLPMTVMGRGMIVAAGNVSLTGDIKRIDDEQNKIPSVFSIIARNGGIRATPTAKNIEACLYADRGFYSSMSCKLKILGNLCVNRFNKKNIKDTVDIYYQSNHCRSSLLSMIRPIAKFDPTRYHVTFSSNVASFKFEKLD